MDVDAVKVERGRTTTIDTKPDDGEEGTDGLDQEGSDGRKEKALSTSAKWGRVGRE